MLYLQIWPPPQSLQVDVFLLCSHLVCYIDFSQHFTQCFVNCAARLLILKHSNDKGCLHLVHRSFSIFISHRAHEKYHLITKNKMDNSAFVDEEDIPMVHQDDYYVDYTLFTELATTETTSTLRLK